MGAVCVQGSAVDYLNGGEARMAINAMPVRQEFVATIDDVDLRQALDESTRRMIEEAIWRYGVLVFHNQPLTEDEQLTFASSFGPLETSLGRRFADETDRQPPKAGILDLSNVSP